MSSSDEEQPHTIVTLEQSDRYIDGNSEQDGNGEQDDSGEQEVLVNSKNNTSDEKEEGKEKKCCKNERRWCIAIIISIAVCIFTIFILIIIMDNSESEGITASIRHSTYSKKTCVDFDYGCCEIYDQCKIVTTKGHQHMDYKKINLDVYVTHAHDSIKSNCVSLRDIVDGYNHVYGRDDCGEHGCCPSINIGCDDVMHYHINDGNNQDLVDTYLQNKTTMVPIKVPKNNTEGTNCWDKDGFLSGITHFTNKYEHGYPIPDDSWSFIPFILGAIGLWCCVAKVMGSN